MYRSALETSSAAWFQAISGGETHTLNTDSSNTAIFLMETYSLGPVRLEAAARQEWQTVKSLITRYPSIRHKPFSASAAAIWNVGSDYSLALSLAQLESRTTRLCELAGAHGASRRVAAGAGFHTASLRVGHARWCVSSCCFVSGTVERVHRAMCGIMCGGAGLVEM